MVYSFTVCTVYSVYSCTVCTVLQCVQFTVCTVVQCVQLYSVYSCTVCTVVQCVQLYSVYRAVPPSLPWELGGLLSQLKPATPAVVMILLTDSSTLGFLLADCWKLLAGY